MTDIPYATEIETTYENFVAACPHCGYRNTYNRASDLKDLAPIAFKEVTCSNVQCSKLFRINGDGINPVYQTLIFDCHKLIEEKRYSYCILNLAQAFEVFFALYLRVEIIYKPFAHSTEHDIDKLNRVANSLYKRIKDQSFAGMRALFLNHLVLSRALRIPEPQSLEDAEVMIGQLAATTPPDSAIERINDPTLVTLLLQMKNSRIGEIRNNVVHKTAYRPTQDEAEAFLKETRNILFQSGQQLGLISDDPNWYWGKS